MPHRSGAAPDSEGLLPADKLGERILLPANVGDGGAAYGLVGAKDDELGKKGERRTTTQQGYCESQPQQGACPAFEEKATDLTKII